MTCYFVCYTCFLGANFVYVLVCCHGNVELSDLENHIGFFLRSNVTRGMIFNNESCSFFYEVETSSRSDFVFYGDSE